MRTPTTVSPRRRRPRRWRSSGRSRFAPLTFSLSSAVQPAVRRAASWARGPARWSKPARSHGWRSSNFSIQTRRRGACHRRSLNFSLSKSPLMHAYWCAFILKTVHSGPHQASSARRCPANQGQYPAIEGKASANEDQNGAVGPARSPFVWPMKANRHPSLSPRCPAALTRDNPRPLPTGVMARLRLNADRRSPRISGVDGLAASCRWWRAVPPADPHCPLLPTALFRKAGRSQRGSTVTRRLRCERGGAPRRPRCNPGTPA